MLFSLQHAITALYAMWEGSKAIHRDLSSGNVYYDDTTNSGRLGDLEFVTFYTDDALQFTTFQGTLQFMACKVSTSYYLISPALLDQCLAVLPDTLDIPDTSDTNLHSTEVYDDIDETPTFLHNPIHDLESVWWLLIWTLLRFHPKSTAPLAPLHHNTLRDQLGVFLSLFPGTQAQHMSTLQSINLKHTSTKISLIGTAQISEHVKYLSAVLVNMYTTVEKSFPIPNTAFHGFHGAVLETLNLISSKVAYISVGKLIPIQDTLIVLEQERRGEVGEIHGEVHGEVDDKVND
ncbi:hypothetical protein CCMSSC00406_0005721 [Pleurotus cornucopiae]|uniref:Uncharacterized protein n=1 Tax=Pleurotus cornucopiae TaxID=5321 RepID=A0ACB7IWA1_PLECO|nr:hypothetical protein CCMSSC00406_0005721 [Pleurotus cornucopiae]